jgi:multicomponent K+:H+ antiporter subunit E
MPRMKYLPHPILSLALAVVWVLLLNDFSLGGFLFGLILGWLIPLFTSAYWPGVPRVRRPLKIAAYGLLVLRDIVVANLDVAYLILFRRNADLKSRFFTVPLDLRTPEAVAILAGTITMTPGTVSCDLSSDGGSLLVHGLNVTDPDAAAADIKRRYESRLKEIFE